MPLSGGERFDGHLMGVFRIQELLGPLLSEHASLGCSIVLFGGEEIIASSADTNRQYLTKWLQETEVEIRNITWRIRVWPRLEPVAIMRSSLSEMTLGAGFLLALLMSIKVRLAQMARLRTEEVGSANQERRGRVSE